MIGERLNYNDTFFRSLTAAVLDILEGEIYWVYKFSTGDKEVTVPFYYSLTGDEKFLLDAFTDDVVSDNRKSELNADGIPRGVVTWTGFDILNEEMTNPNVWMKMSIEEQDEVKNVLARVRAMPISAKYDVSIILNSVNDVFECAAAIMNTLGQYRYFSFQYNFINILGVVQLPDSGQFEKETDISFTSDNKVKYNMSFEVKTCYPAFRKPRTGIRPNEFDTWGDSYTYDPFKKPQDEIIIPRRTKWYSNIYKATGNGDDGGSINSTNGNPF